MKRRLVLIQPLVVRLFHWAITAGVILLVITGFYIAWPTGWVPFLNMRTARELHFSTGFITIFLVLGRFYYAVATGDYHNLLFRLRDFRQVPALLRFTFFLQDRSPDQEKYNVGQKFLFTSWFIVFVLVALSGVILYQPDPWEVILPFVGGLQGMRYFQFTVALFFALTIFLHVYLAAIDDPARLQAIFTGWIRVSSDKPEGGERTPSK